MDFSRNQSGPSRESDLTPYFQSRGPASTLARLKSIHISCCLERQKEAADRCAAARMAAETANREREERLQSMCKRATQLLTELLSRLSGSSPVYCMFVTRMFCLPS